MENHRRVTEEDLLITEALIAKSYCQLKQSVIQVPSRAFTSAGQTARRHPYATAAVAIVAGVAMYGIFKMGTSRASTYETPGRSISTRKKDTGHADLMQQMLLMIIPLVFPYIGGFIQKYLGKILSGERG
jgi:membrane protein insertase Oxa1/YidC/SpoIIIJ